LPERKFRIPPHLRIDLLGSCFDPLAGMGFAKYQKTDGRLKKFIVFDKGVILWKTYTTRICRPSKKKGVKSMKTKL
jgi:hypothetical protein